MDITHIKQLAGIQINEITQIPSDASLEQIQTMLAGAYKGLGLVNKLRNPIEKKRHLRAVFININKIRIALHNYMQE